MFVFDYDTPHISTELLFLYGMLVLLPFLVSGSLKSMVLIMNRPSKGQNIVLGMKQVFSVYVSFKH